MVHTGSINSRLHNPNAIRNAVSDSEVCLRKLWKRRPRTSKESASTPTREDSEHTRELDHSRDIPIGKKRHQPPARSSVIMHSPEFKLCKLCIAECNTAVRMNVIATKFVFFQDHMKFLQYL